MAAEIKAQAQQEAQHRLQRAEDEIDREREKAKETLKEQVIHMSFRTAEKILRQKLDDPAQRKLVANSSTKSESRTERDDRRRPLRPGAVRGDREAGETVRALADMNGLATLLAPLSAVGRQLACPQLRLQDKRAALEAVLRGRVAPTVAVFIDLLLRKKRLANSRRSSARSRRWSSGPRASIGRKS